MGINYKLYKINKNIKKEFVLNNQSLKINFYTTLIFWGTYNKQPNAILNNFLLGKRYGFSILNAEHHVILLKRAAKLIFELKTSKQQILFVNDSLNSNFDGIVKAFAFRSLQHYVIGKWPKGFFIKKKFLNFSVFFFNPSQSLFSLKEANSLGIPVIGFNGLDNDFVRMTYPILCNNHQGDSIFFNSFIVSNSIIEGHLYQFVKKKIKF